MSYVLICIDKPGQPEVRTAARQAHLDYVAASGVVSIAGPFLDDAGAMTGSMIVLDVATRDEAENWAANDPYAKAGVFGSVDIRGWKRTI